MCVIERIQRISLVSIDIYRMRQQPKLWYAEFFDLPAREQIIEFLKQAEGGVPVKELCRKSGFNDTTFCKWRGA
jgi:Transposase